MKDKSKESFCAPIELNRFSRMLSYQIKVTNKCLHRSPIGVAYLSSSYMYMQVRSLLNSRYSQLILRYLIWNMCSCLYRNFYKKKSTTLGSSSEVGGHVLKHMCAVVVDSLRIWLSRKYISKSSPRVVRKTTFCFVGWLMFFDSQNIF